MVGAARHREGRIHGRPMTGGAAPEVAFRGFAHGPHNGPKPAAGFTLC